MTKQELIAYCLTKVGAIHDYKAEWEADRVQVSNKMFALIGSLSGRLIISLKCDIRKAELLREQHKEIIPGYYLNKAHWNSLFMDGELSPDLIKTCIDDSYQLVVRGLPKKTQKIVGVIE